MTPDPLTDLCAILRRERELPTGEAGDRLVALARAHGVAGLLPGRAPHLNRRDALLDEMSVRELLAVLGAFEADGLEPLVFKGAALAHTHYLESWMRPRFDSDVLITADGRHRAFEILRGLGYQQPPLVSGELVSYQARFVRIDDIHLQHIVDVHWQIGNPQAIAHALTHRELIARADVLMVRGRMMRVPSAVDALLLACVHRAAHHGDADDLIWLYDIHLIATTLDPGQWAQLVERAVDRQIAAISSRGLALATRRFHTHVPDDARGRLAGVAGPSRKTGSAMTEPSAIFLRKDLRAIDRLAADLRALGPRQGVRLLREHLFPPASYVRGKYGVRSRVLLPAFYAYRIMAGASRWLRPSRIQ